MALESLPKISPANFSPDNDLIQVYSKKGDYVGVINPSYIKSSPSGVAGAIQFSDGSAFASSSNLTWNNATNALGLGSGTTSAFIDFASNPAGSTTIVGAIRTYVDGVNLSEVMSFREDGFIGMGTPNPSNKVEIRGANFTNVLRIGGANTGRDFLFNPYYATNTYGGFFSNESGNITLGASLGTDNGSGIGIILGAPSGTRTALLQVKGTGSTSATTSLLVQNSGGTDLVRVQDNGVLTLGTFASGLGKIVVTCDPSYGTKSVLENNFGGQIIRQQSTDVVIFGGQQIASLTAIGYMGLSAPYIVGNNPIGNTTGSSFDFRVTGSPYAQTPSTPSRGVLFDGGLNFQSGGYANYFELSPTYTFDISNNRIVKGIYYNPTLVTPNTNDKHYGIQTTSGGAYINTTTPQDSACLQADSTTQGFLPPRMTDAQIRAIASPTNGLVAYNTDINHLCCYQNGAWAKFSHSPM